MGKFRELKVWQRGKDLAVFIYKLTDHGIFSRDYGLRDQIRRAAISIPSNIAEGDELSTDKQSIRFFYTAKGSSAEILTQAIIALEAETPPQVAAVLRSLGAQVVTARPRRAALARSA